MATAGRWGDVRVLARTGSTNADVAAAARSGAPEGLVVVAEEQTAGRGRLDRRWQAPAGTAITMSVLLRPRVAPARLGWLPLLTGVAVADAIAPTGLGVGLKWPNDLLVGDPPGKCGGILAEVVDGAVVVGLGINVSQSADDLPPAESGALPPTSLRLAGASLDRSVLRRDILVSLGDWYARWHEVGGDPSASGLHAAYLAACRTIGRDVVVSLPGGASVRGRAAAVDLDGRLVVDGRALAAGDVRHVR